jgi:hypothetical protein
MRKQLARLGALVLVLAAVAAGPRAASAGEEQPPDPRDPMQTQMRLIYGADQISAAAKGAKGMAGIIVSTDKWELDVYWKGQLPDPVAEAIGKQRNDIGVNLREARYSEAELADAVSRIVEGGGITSAGPLSDGSGIIVGVPGDEASGWDLPEVRAAGVPVTILPYVKAMLASDRQHDNPPYKGGAMMHWPLGGGYIGLCTSGFSIRQGGISKMLSAGHCRDDGDTVLDGNNNTIGTVEQDNNTRDTLLIGTSAQGSTYIGAHNSSTSKPHHMALGAYVNTLVCTSGAMSGQHCNVRVKQVNQTILVDDGTGGSYTIHPVVMAEQDAHTTAVAQGDSGGPVMAQDQSTNWWGGGGIYYNYPGGTITALDPSTTVPCPPTAYSPTVCAWRMFYVDIMDSLEYYGAVIAPPPSIILPCPGWLCP